MISHEKVQILFFILILNLIFALRQNNDHFMKFKSFSCDFKDEFKNVIFTDYFCNISLNRKFPAINFRQNLMKEVSKLYVNLKLYPRN